MDKNNLKSRFIAAIEQTGDPLAPIKMQDAYVAATALGKLMAYGSTVEKSQEYIATMLKDFPEDMEHIARDPCFILTLCSMLTNSIVAYGKNLKEIGK